MDTVEVLRLDQLGGLAPGNKLFKLRHNIAAARASGVTRLVSFGGAWSNHLHALAAVGREEGLDTVGVVRGEPGPTESAMLCDARRWGMQIEYVSRSDYRLRADPAWLGQLQRQFDPCLIIPEGGANLAGAKGCIEPGEWIAERKGHDISVLLPVGTGTTMAGVIAGMGGAGFVRGVSVLRGAADLEARVQTALDGLGAGHYSNWSILHDAHCGGYARVNQQLKEFIMAFEQGQGIPLDPVYTGKAMLALQGMIRSGTVRDNSCFIHTGGLQGRRGYDWLAACP